MIEQLVRQSHNQQNIQQHIQQHPRSIDKSDVNGCGVHNDKHNNTNNDNTALAIAENHQNQGGVFSILQWDYFISQNRSFNLQTGFQWSRLYGGPQGQYGSIDGLSAAYANTGFLGIPLCALVFGDAGLMPAMGARGAASGRRALPRTQSR